MGENLCKEHAAAAAQEEEEKRKEHVEAVKKAQMSAEAESKREQAKAAAKMKRDEQNVERLLILQSSVGSDVQPSVSEEQESKVRWDLTPPTVRTVPEETAPSSPDTVSKDLSGLKQTQLELQSELASLSPSQLRIKVLEQERAERLSSPKYQDQNLGVSFSSSKEGIVRIISVTPGGEVIQTEPTCTTLPLAPIACLLTDQPAFRCL
jgi:hypothetical protein